ncbi:MAG: hypothetical protein NWF06_03195 [Candidatus Bathyarchaeota archaeon]|nr:hypothetical protein [Candidatus Bathyarchaeum sp.]
MKKNNSVLFILVFLVALCIVFVSSVFSSEDIVNNSWISKAPMQQPRSGLGVVAVNNKIYAIGGTNQEGFSAITEEYNVATNTWTFKSSMPTARSAFGIAVYQNKIYCIGGYTDGFSATGVTEVYDPATDTWETKSPMSNPRLNMQANVVNDKIYLIGGNPNGTVTEVYDPATDTWSNAISIPVSVESYASAVVDNKIYVITSNLTQIYSVENDSWSYGTAPLSPVVLASAGATTGMFASERIYVFGADADLPYWQLTLRNFTTQSYNPKTNTWEICASMPTGRFDTGVAVVNDTLYVIGGYITEFPRDVLTLNPTITYCTVNEQYIPTRYIPEFLSWILMLCVLLVITVITVSYKKRLWNSNRSK